MRERAYGRTLVFVRKECYNSSGKYQIQSGKRAVLSKAELL